MQQALIFPDASSPRLNAIAPHFGGHRDPGSLSGPTIIAALIPTFAIAVLYLSVFVVIRPWYRKIYSPRTFLGTIPEKDHTPDTSSSRLAFLRNAYKTLGDQFVLQHSSLDAYLYLRFLRFTVALCLLGTCMTWPILLPVNASGRGNSTQLDRFSFSNINRNDILWAHVTVACLFFGAVTALIIRERLRLIGVRQAYHLHPNNSKRLSYRTVLFLNVPHDDLAPERLHPVFGSHAVKSWPVQQLDELESLVGDRHDAALELEAALIEMTKKTNEARIRKLKDKSDSQIENAQLVPAMSRPTRRTRLWFGEKVDTIEWGRETIEHLTDRIEEFQQSKRTSIPSDQSAVFVAYSSQMAAHRAYEDITFNPRLLIEHRFLNVAPREAIWSNLVRTTSNRASKASIALVFVIAFTIFFSIPAGLIGTISNVEYLADNVEWLGFINRLPKDVIAVLQGLLPPFLVSWFVSYVPKLFRHIAVLSGEPTTPQAELKTQAWFFAFSVIQVFLITTFSSGAAAVTYKIIKDPANAPALLASSVPTASNFYMTYFILQGTASVADALLNYSDLFEYLFYDKFWTGTPRAKYDLFVDVKGIPYGKLYPKFTNLLVIALAYSCIAPLVIGFATVGLALYYLCYKYQFLYVCQSKLDTRGEMYKRALKQMTTGVYLAETCLLGLLGARQGVGQTACIGALLVGTAVVNAIADILLHPLELFLGLDGSEEQAPLLAGQDGAGNPEAVDLDLVAHTHRMNLRFLPRSISLPFAYFLESIITSGREEVKGYLGDSKVADDDDETPTLNSKELETAYLNPALTAKTPLLWLAKDKAGVSKQEIEENRKAGIESTDQGAELDAKNKIVWSKDDFSQVPIFKKPVRRPAI